LLTNERNIRSLQIVSKVENEEISSWFPLKSNFPKISQKKRWSDALLPNPSVLLLVVGSPAVSTTGILGRGIKLDASPPELKRQLQRTFLLSPVSVEGCMMCFQRGVCVSETVTSCRM
jgi:hypothetical protein